MVSVEALLAATLFGIVACYVVVAGSDLGAGVWYLFAGGPRAAQQRQASARSIGPGAEGHQVWLLLMAVVLCAAFPIAFGRMILGLTVPVAVLVLAVLSRLALLAWHLRISADRRRHRLVDVLLALSTLVPPVVLSASIATLSTGRLTSSSAGETLGVWLTPFPLTVGVLGLALFAMLAALTLFLQTRDKVLREDFRRRAFGAVIVANGCAMVALALSRHHAPLIWRGLTGTVAGWTLIGLESMLVILTLFCLLRREAGGARHIGMAAVVVLLIGWAYAQYPFLLVPDVSIYNSAAPDWSLRYLVAVLLLAGILFPSLYYVYRLFKGGLTLRKA